VREDYTDFEHTGPGTLAGRYMRTFWHPIYRAEDLAPGESMPIQIMSERFTLYRGEGGAPHLVAFRCAHRGTQLSTGWVEEDCIRCLYHGWKYDGNGQCVEQPGEDAAFASKVRIRSYPLHEYLGLIWAYLGEGEAPPLRRYPDLEKPGVLLTQRPERWPCNYYNRLDNDADAAHVRFTHQESTTRAGTVHRYDDREVTAQITEYGVVTISNRGGGLKEYMQTHMPNSNQIRVKTGAASGTGGNLVLEDRVIWSVPIDDDNSLRCEVDLVHLTGEAGEAHRQRFRERERALKPPNELGDLILAGKLRIQDLAPEMSVYELFRVEDYVAQVGQSRMAERPPERWGRIDVGVVMRRKLWERELAALAQGRPLTQWHIPDGLAEMTPEELEATASSA
jgi:5,5'-dehydrodivanillate O-demethylase oxygenase subunit